MKKEKFNRCAELLPNGKIQISSDPKSVVVRAVRDSDYADWPDLEKPKKRGRKKKVVTDGDDQGTAESSPE